jgi:hypothetical protein
MATKKDTETSNDTILPAYRSTEDNSRLEKDGLRTYEDGEDHDHEPPVRKGI